MFFPDLPGCTSAGDTLQAAALRADEVLGGHLAVSIDHGDRVARNRSRFLADAARAALAGVSG